MAEASAITNKFNKERATPILIIGGLGHLGMNILERLHDGGFAKVTVIDRDAYQTKEEAKILFPRFDYVIADASDSQLLSQALERTKPENVLYLVGPCPTECENPSKEVIDKYTKAFSTAIERCIGSSYVKRFVYASSYKVMTNITKESCTLADNSDQHIGSIVDLEGLLARTYENLAGLVAHASPKSHIVGMRYCELYGPYLRMTELPTETPNALSFQSRLFRSLVKSENLEMYKAWKKSRVDWVYTPDAAIWTLEVLFSSDTIHTKVNVSMGAPLSHTDFAAKANSIARNKSLVESGGYKSIIYTGEDRRIPYWIVHQPPKYINGNSMYRGYQRDDALVSTYDYYAKREVMKRGIMEKAKNK